ncbi:helix-turn-helix transcriptional regulator [Streptomyces griseoincarnatus]|uniref:helix-turn-helix transcriptional regulator n=1 Tax=Streptomyces sp. ME01-18h TaxID=462920 RepID=UPI0029A58767|nr:helix-turn-helix transcriptional regulator [Streptomyces sp. ME01-18h]MDX3400057.1 helix-turn-helix transcriptional regulator [Streptomyces sp. ME01-18h]
MLATPAERIRSRLGILEGLPDPDERRRLREEAGLSQQDIADAVGSTRAAVGHWETGFRSPRGRLLTAYVDVLRVLREAA